jgi:transposase
MLFRWRRQLGEKGEVFPGAGVARDQELLPLKREFAQVKRERFFLRDAAAYFVSESR